MKYYAITPWQEPTVIVTAHELRLLGSLPPAWHYPEDPMGIYGRHYGNFAAYPKGYSMATLRKLATKGLIEFRKDALPDPSRDPWPYLLGPPPEESVRITKLGDVVLRFAPYPKARRP